MGLFDRLKAGLKKTKDVLRTDVRDLFRAGDILDDGLLEKFEGRLIRTDMGVAATDRRLRCGLARCCRARPERRRAHAPPKGRQTSSDGAHFGGRRLGEELPAGHARWHLGLERL